MRLSSFTCALSFSLACTPAVGPTQPDPTPSPNGKPAPVAEPDAPRTKPAGATYTLAVDGETVTLDGEAMGKLHPDKPYKIEPLFTTMKTRFKEKGTGGLAPEATWLDIDDAAGRRVWLSAVTTLTYALHPRMMIASGAELSLYVPPPPGRSERPSRVSIALFDDVAFVRPLRVMANPSAAAAVDTKVSLAGDRRAVIASLGETIRKGCADPATQGNTVLIQTGTTLSFGALALAVDAIAGAAEACGGELIGHVALKPLTPNAREVMLEREELRAHPEKAKYHCSYVLTLPSVSFCAETKKECDRMRIARMEPDSPLSPCEGRMRAHCFTYQDLLKVEDCKTTQGSCESFQEFVESKGKRVIERCAPSN